MRHKDRSTVQLLRSIGFENHQAAFHPGDNPLPNLDFNKYRRGLFHPICSSSENEFKTDDYNSGTGEPSQIRRLLALYPLPAQFSGELMHHLFIGFLAPSISNASNLLLKSAIGRTADLGPYLVEISRRVVEEQGHIPLSIYQFRSVVCLATHARRYQVVTSMGNSRTTAAVKAWVSFTESFS